MDPEYKSRIAMLKNRMVQFWQEHHDDVSIAIGVMLVVFTAFGLGRATAPYPPKADLIVEELPVGAALAPAPASVAGENVPRQATPPGQFIASKNGTRYYLPTCSGAKRIKEENRIWFASEEEARAQGYEPAANCPGLK